MAIYTRKTLFKTYINDLDTRSNRACQEAIDWCREIDSKTPDCTFGQGIDALTRDDWAYWCVSEFCKDFDDEVRAGFIKLIKDPMMSLQACLKIPISAADEIELKKNYEGKLPVAEKELADGVIVKETING